MLDDGRIARYSRQLLVPGFGEEAQERLLAARVRAVGVDAVASAALVQLVQAGIGLLWIDDAAAVSPADLAGWVFAPSSVGAPRAPAACAALRALSSYSSVEPYPAGGVPTAAMVMAPSAAQALVAAEAARRAGVPHVVVEPDADGGAVVTVPPGAPCYACARSTSRAGRTATVGGASALGAVAACELVQMIAMPGSVQGRRVEIVHGVVAARPTVRLAGCSCGRTPERRA